MKLLQKHTHTVIILLHSLGSANKTYYVNEKSPPFSFQSFHSFPTLHTCQIGSPQFACPNMGGPYLERNTQHYTTLRHTITRYTAHLLVRVIIRPE